MVAPLGADQRTVHPFPARMSAAVAFEEHSRLTGERRVLDSIAGSGTTLRTARALGHKPIGFDTDTLAILLAGRHISYRDPIRSTQ